ncbi:nucleotidyltransferase family protein [Thermococcus sp. SY098]|uniref:nucleotidyltransferase family protein n=1 Tax=Thermococcus sp. SY098 TaxID=3111325 RepID=UPI002D7A0763|nr:nucleotidyltransferase family protein [Thermococcus sp. SY098]WRS52150.1 nucleotidyltransferase family protein [Thermococcus sp. SY098]
MKTLEEIERILREHKEELKRKFKVKEIGIFGSYVRREAEETSDVDILVDFYETPSLFEFIELEIYLSDLLGVKVDLVMKKALKPRIKEYILREVVYV